MLKVCIFALVKMHAPFSIPWACLKLFGDKELRFFVRGSCRAFFTKGGWNM